MVVPEWLLIYFRAPEKFDHFVDWESFDLQTLLVFDAMLARVYEAELGETNALYERYQATLYRQYYSKAQGSNRSVVINSQSDLNSSQSTSIEDRTQQALGGLLSNSDTQVNRLSPSNTVQRHSNSTIVRHLSSGMADYRFGPTSRPFVRMSDYIPQHQPSAMMNARPRSSVIPNASRDIPKTGYENIAQILANERLKLQHQQKNQFIYHSTHPLHLRQKSEPLESSSLAPPLPRRIECTRVAGNSDCHCSRCANFLPPYNMEEMGRMLPLSNGFFLPAQPQQQTRAVPFVKKRFDQRLPPSPLTNEPDASCSSSSSNANNNNNSKPSC